MKRFLALTLVAAGLTSCSTPQQNAQVAAIANLALTYAEVKGAIKPEEAALVREAGKIILTPEPAATVVTAAK